jgi:hypothetical protein
MRASVLLALLVIFTLPGAAAAAPPAQAAGWGPVVSVSQSPDNYAFGATATYDVFGALHIAWEQWDNKRDETARIFYRTNRGGAWGEPTVVSGGVRPARMPALAADAAGNVHLAFAGGERGTSNQIFYAALTADNRWHGPTLVQDTNRKNGAARPTIISDAGSNAHVLWMHDKPGGYDIAMRTHRADGEWSDMSYVIKNDRYSDRPRGLAIGGTLHVVTKLRTDDGDIIAYTQGDGRNWSEPRRLSSGDTRIVYAPSITTDGWRLFAAWDHAPGDHDIHFAMSSDGGASWTNPVRVDRPKGIATNPSLTTVAGRLLLVWQLEDRLLARPMDLGSLEWGGIDELNRDHKGEVKEPELVSGPGDQAAVVWHQRRGDTDMYEILLAEWRK